MMEYFVKERSIVREIWGKADTILLIFAGSAAEFALNKAVDWLYFTGNLPSDPLQRLFRTVAYAKNIIFAEEEAALKTIDKIAAIHASVEASRGANIPDWAYRDVLFMLIHYSVASFELMERKLTIEEKEEVYDVFLRVGNRMNLKDLPENYKTWIEVREQHLQNDLEKSHYTVDLYRQYKKHLGAQRYKILIQSQKLVVPQRVKELLFRGKISWLTPLLNLYKLSRKIKMDGVIKFLILPPQYRTEIKALDIA